MSSLNPQSDNQIPHLFARLLNKLQVAGDTIHTPIEIDEENAQLLFIKSVIDGNQLQNTIIKPFFELASEKRFLQYLDSLPNKIEIVDEETLLVELTRGMLLINVQQRYVLIDIKKVNTDSVQITSLEPTIYGPQGGLSESLETNINLLRQRYAEPSLAVEITTLTDRSKSVLAILYDKEVVDTEVLDTVRKRLGQLNNPLIQSTADLELYLNQEKFALFPSTLLTERPDRIVYNLAGGKVIIMLDGSPQVTMAPAVFFDFMVSMDDHYHNFWTSISTTFLRYAGLFTCTVLPALYVAIISYNPDVIRTELALTVAGSRIGVPYPSYIEVIFMLVFIELLTEASIRLPKAVSATATTVGGLILGTAVVEAALASNIMIIVVSLVAISTFVIPINEMSFSVRATRFFLLLYATLFGLAGVIIGFVGIIMYLANKESFGKPYLKFYWKNRSEEIKGGLKK
ncbi:spore germination protein [Sporosarcina sp. Sa2YVA2]|uniref:Spore germination protein n=1 Tax=Sporosarcina quadrami TaxID=2762234 RepID=A0ABR8UEJ5_9BACL|nr:spore germination protein [Sporosarcina quadrami]